MGLVTFGFELLNQNGGTVMTLRTSIMFGRRQPTTAAGRA
jgi:hypothetical protein